MLTMTSVATLQGVLPRLFAHRPMYVRTPSRCCIRPSKTVSQAGGPYKSRSGLLFQHVRYLKPLSIPLVTDYSMG